MDKRLNLFLHGTSELKRSIEMVKNDGCSIVDAIKL